MAEIIQCYREAVPAMRFIGRKYDGFTSWGECFSTDTFGAIERAMGGVEAVRALWKDGGYVGLERHCDGEPFAYYIGMFKHASACAGSTATAPMTPVHALHGWKMRASKSVKMRRAPYGHFKTVPARATQRPMKRGISSPTTRLFWRRRIMICLAGRGRQGIRLLYASLPVRETYKYYCTYQTGNAVYGVARFCW